MAGILLALVAALAFAPAASADTTHLFLGQLELKGSFGPQPIGIDDDGNIIVWQQPEEVIAKYSPTGDPVNFSALGSNKIDGKGGQNCPSVPADCDRIPANGFGTAFISSPLSDDTVFRAAMDQSGGMTDGYIYVTAQSPPKGDEPIPFATYEVFDSSGTYLGQLDDGQAYPRRSPTEPAESLTTDSLGNVYLGYGKVSECHIDKYVPVDLDPEHTEFASQLAFGTSYTVNALDAGCAARVGADENFVYVSGGPAGFIPAGALWRKYPQAQFERRLKGYEFSTAIDFSPTKCRCAPTNWADQSGHLFSAFAFGDGGLQENLDINSGGFFLNQIGVDPVTDDVYLLDEGMLNIEQWSPENERIGPVFGGRAEIDPGSETDPEVFPAPWPRSLAFDHSGGPTEGRIYLKGSGTNRLAIYGPPVTIPDIENAKADPDHDSVTISADIGLAGGPPVESCQIEYGTTLNYGNTISCNPSVPFGSDTEMATEIGGLTTEADYYYRIKAGNSNGTNITEGLLAHPVAVLSVKTGEATEATPATVTLNGELDRDGLSTEYRFEYGLDTDYPVATPFVAIGDEAGLSSVPPVQLDKLQPGQKYHYRLVARNSLGTTYGNDRTFIAPSSPGINALRATDVSASEATLESTIDTKNFETTYQFEFGTTTDYGNKTPAVPAELTASDTPFDVSQQLGGLREGVTYHYRVVATNQWGTVTSDDSTFSFGETSCPNAHVRQQTGATHLPDCRAYELVSPGDFAPLSLLPGSVLQGYDYNTGPLAPFFKIPALNPSGLASSPARFAYVGTVGTLPGTNPPNSLLDRYVATRTPNGWVSTYPGIKANETRNSGLPECSVSMHRCIDYDGFDASQRDPSDEGSRAPYLWDVGGASLGRLPTNLAEIPGAADRPFKYLVPIESDDTISPDFGHYVFSSIGGMPFTDDGKVVAPGSTYDNDVEAKTVAVASRLPSGEDIPQDSGNSAEFMLVPAVSMDGSHILMSTVAAGNSTNLYMRVDGGISYEVSRGEGVKFVGMTEGGDRVVFTTDKQLTPDDTDSSVDLFLWEEEGDQLTRISQGDGAGDSDACNASWISGCGVEPIRGEEEFEDEEFRALTELDDELALSSGDVYFASPEQLDSSNPGVPGERNLYVYREGAVKYVTTLGPGAKINRVQISPDGRFAAFLTPGRLTAYDNRGYKEVYRYSADSGFIQCVSCMPSGEPPSIPHILPTRVGGDPPEPEFDVMASLSGRFMSDDGRVVFTTSDPLVSRDTNELLDIYEFTEGRAQLISSGVGQSDAYTGSGRVSLFKPGFIGVEGISRDGRDIYFSTLETLVPQDKIGSFIKFYDARTNGGFEPEPEFEPCVAADECHGDGVAAPPTSRIGTGGSLGAGGNAASETAPRKATKPRKGKRAAKRRAKKRRAAAARLKTKARERSTRG